MLAGEGSVSVGLVVVGVVGELVVVVWQAVICELMPRLGTVQRVLAGVFEGELWVGKLPGGALVPKGVLLLVETRGSVGAHLLRCHSFLVRFDQWSWFFVILALVKSSGDGPRLELGVVVVLESRLLVPLRELRPHKRELGPVLALLP